MREQLPLMPKRMPKWFWPLVALLILSFCAFVAAIWATTAARRHSEPVKMALALAQADARVAALAGPGETVAPGLLVVGDSKTIEGEEVCRWKFHIKGARGEGTLLMNAVRPSDAGAWKVDFLQAYLPGQGSDLITLVGDAAHPPQDFATADTRRESAQTRLALNEAQKDPGVQSLGLPVEPGFWVDGADAATLDGVERCAWSFKLKGAKAEGKLRFQAKRAKDSREWTLEELAFTPPGAAKEIHLPLPQATPKEEARP